MAILVVCDDCGDEFRAKDEHAGRKVSCPSCGTAIRIPDPDSSPRRGGSRAPARRSRSSGSSSSAMPTWALGVMGGGGVVIVGLLVALLFRGGSDDTPAPNAVAVAQPTATATDPNAAASAAPAGHDAASTTPQTGTPATAPNTAAAALTPTGTAPANAVPAVQPTASVTPAAAGHAAQPVASATPTTTPAAAGHAAQPNAVAATTPMTTPAAPTQPGTTPANGTAPVATAARDKPFPSVADLIEAIEPSVVRISMSSPEGEGAGSGYVIDTEGTMVTNYHVVEGATRCTGRFRDDKKAEYPITGIYYIDEKRDIAIVKIEAPKDKLHPLSLAKDLPRKGEELVAFGAPLGLDFTTTQGNVSAIRDAQELLALGIPDYQGTWLQHSVPISPGNSGGPLVNMKGEVVGMNTMTITIGQNLNFAISAKDVADGLTKKQSTARPLGAPGSVPERKARRGKPTPPKDVVGTDEAKQFLAKLTTMDIIMLRVGFDPSGRITATVREDFEKSLSNAKIRVQDGAGAFMLVGMELDDAGGTRANQSLTIFSTCLYRDENGQVYKIYEEREKVGNISDQLFFQGGMPKTMRANISKYFQKFSLAVNRAKNEAKKAGSSTTSGTK